jgi:glycine/D-amino acid oxidase-like deaminating enzyme
MPIYDRIIVGAGFYGLYSALFCARKGETVALVEMDSDPFSRATYSNQARIHLGYHYPRSFATAIKSARYFERFNNEFGFCVHSRFDQIYAISENFSWTSAEQFKSFCQAVSIPCDEISVSRYFKPSMCDGAFLTREYTYDAQILKRYFVSELEKQPKIRMFYNAHISDVENDGKSFSLRTQDGMILSSSFVLNASYASVNQVASLFGHDPFPIKYELCEIILCDTNDDLKEVGITVMDGPFFSIMPFGKTGRHSLTSVTFTPHEACYSTLPSFSCQACSVGYCSESQLGNCNLCHAKPTTAWHYMNKLAKKYINDRYDFKYGNSLFAVKPILKASEIDDSRPTVIKRHGESPSFVSVLSGKINTVYDLDELLT